MKPIQMVDLASQYFRLQKEIDAAMAEVLTQTTYINGPAVEKFRLHMQEYLGVRHVIPCANGTDALQIALMALDLKPGDEIIVPAFTYVATAEVAALLGLKIVMVDVDPDTFNLRLSDILTGFSPRTKAVVPVHLFGQSCDMEPILEWAKLHQIAVIEDNAQAIGARYFFTDGRQKMTGTMGRIGTTSFYPSKNLGAYGDGGAIMTEDENLALRLKMIANHGQKQRYYHDIIGMNSRLDSLQAALLDVKLSHLDSFCDSRQAVAAYYDQRLQQVAGIQIPKRQQNSTHVFHQYTIKVEAKQRDALQNYLKENLIPTMVYYPLPLFEQPAFQRQAMKAKEKLEVTEMLCKQVLSLPVHTEMDEEQLDFICNLIERF
jgi:UDP-2-acetamido-2-deoxy-ribo-hexuluronate aminotransferase